MVGRAVVFESLEDLARRVDAPELDVAPDDILVLRNAGPIGGPGMPEAGALPIPKKLAGLKDMVRISDARMSGTAFGTVVLHVAPEAAAGGPLALVRTGDRIELSVDERRLDLDVEASELARRRTEFRAAALPARGYDRLYARARAAGAPRVRLRFPAPRVAAALGPNGGLRETWFTFERPAPWLRSGGATGASWSSARSHASVGADTDDSRVSAEVHARCPLSIPSRGRSSR